MLILISPAKSLDFSPSALPLTATAPRLLDDTKSLAKTAKRLSRKDLGRLMDISPALADLNWQRFQALELETAPDNTSSLSAALAFNGDVYQGLQARDLSVDQMAFAQDHLRILSGLYGVLRPLDAIAPHRLEMGTKLKTRRGQSLYDFWGPRIAARLKADLADHAASHPTSDGVVINLASNEYFKAVDTKALKAPVITCHFKETKGDQARVLSFFAKRARGMMARFAITNRIVKAKDLQAFDAGGYRFDAAMSSPQDWVFTRPQVDPDGQS